DYSAVCRFLERWSPQQAADHPSLNPPPANFGVFQIRAQPGYVHEREAVQTYWKARLQRDSAARADAITGFCSVSGVANVPLARIHEPKIKGVVGGQTAGG